MRKNYFYLKIITIINIWFVAQLRIFVKIKVLIYYGSNKCKSKKVIIVNKLP